MTARTIPAAQVKITVEDATIDLLCYQHLMATLRDRRIAGAVKGYTEATLVANPQLSSVGMILPLGATVVLPEFVIASAPAQVERLWDE